MCTLYWIAFPANMKSSTVQDGKQRQRTETSRSQRNKHRKSVGREGLVPKSQSLLVNVYFRLGSAQTSTPRS